MKTLADFELPKEFETKSGDIATIHAVNLASDRPAIGFITIKYIDSTDVISAEWDINGKFFIDKSDSTFDLIITQGDQL